MNKNFSSLLPENIGLKAILFIALFALITSIFPADATANDRSFYFPHVDIEAEIRPDGSMGTYNGICLFLGIKKEFWV